MRVKMIFRLTLHAKQMIEEREISMKWIEQALDFPNKVEQDKKDPDLKHYLRRIMENNDKILRVVVNSKADPIKIVTAYFDRTIKDFYNER